MIVEGDRIVDGRRRTAPAGARTLDLGDVTLLPGLIDLHTHLTDDLSTADWLAEPVRGTPASWALRGATNARTTLRARASPRCATSARADSPTWR